MQAVANAVLGEGDQHPRLEAIGRVPKCHEGKLVSLLVYLSLVCTVLHVTFHT